MKPSQRTSPLSFHLHPPSFSLSLSRVSDPSTRLDIRRRVRFRSRDLGPVGEVAVAVHAEEHAKGKEADVEAEAAHHQRDHLDVRMGACACVKY